MPIVPAAGFVVLVMLVAGLPLGVWARGARKARRPFAADAGHERKRLHRG